MGTDKMPETQSTRGNRPGAMTVAMQAVQARSSGPKVLRIGIIQGGRIVEERVIRRRETVTVGTSEKNHFVIQAPGMPARFELFQLVGGDYILNFTEHVTGRVGLPGGVQELTQMRASGAARNAGTHYQVKLNENSRGKVAFGATTLLFQFVVPPPVQPRPQLPAAARAGLINDIDWVFTAFMVFSFMSMFGFIVYLENADWPIDEGIAAVPEEYSKVVFDEPPPPPPEALPETPMEDPSAQSEDKAEKSTPAPTQKPDKSDKPAKAEAPGPKADHGGETAESSSEKSARIAQEAAQAAEALVVGALSSAAGGALQDVLAGGAVTGNAQDVLSQARGVGVAKSSSGGDLRQRAGGGSSGVSAGLGSLARREGTTQGVSEGGPVVERKVSGSVRQEKGDEIDGSGEFDSKAVVAMIKSRLRAIQMCYEQQLRRNPTLAGKVTIEFTIQPRGNVTDVKAKENSTGDQAVATCVANTVSMFRFNPGPEGGSVTYSYPFVFAPQN